MNEKCYACERAMKATPLTVFTSDDQPVHVGSRCFYRTLNSGVDGYQPPKGGPRLYAIQFRRIESHQKGSTK